MIDIVRNGNIAEKVVFVDGLPGCGKTLFSNIISAMDRVELLSYTYEIEYICQLFYLDKITIDAAKSVISMQTDLKLYNCMMGRDTNFRPSDLSSVMKYHNPSKYFHRILQEGDDKILNIIKEESDSNNFFLKTIIKNASINSKEITIGSGFRKIKCFYTVYAERKDVGKLKVEI